MHFVMWKIYFYTYDVGIVSMIAIIYQEITKIILKLCTK